MLKLSISLSNSTSSKRNGEFLFEVNVKEIVNWSGQTVVSVLNGTIDRITQEKNVSSQLGQIWGFSESNLGILGNLFYFHKFGY